MRHPIAYGIDFGTTNSSIAVAWDNGEVEVISIEVDAAIPTCLPSIVYLDRQGVTLAGTGGLARYAVTGANRTACSNCPLVIHEDGAGYSDCRQYRPGSTCHDARLIAGVKSEFANDNFIFTHSWAIDFDLPAFAAVIVERLIAAAQTLSSQPVRRFVMGHPVAFVGAEGPHFQRRQELGEQRLRETARRFGAEEIELYPEPAAAVLGADITDGTAVMIDFGGGTFDVAVMQVSGNEANITALQGAAIGGQLFDQEIFKTFVGPQLGLNKVIQKAGRDIFYPARLEMYLRSLDGLKFLLADPDTLAILKSLRADGMPTGPVEELLYGGQGYNLYQAIEAAKIALSDRDSADIRFQRGELTVSAHLDRSDFERLIDPYLDTAFHAVEAALAKAGVTPTDVDVVYRTGGSSLIPRFVDRLQELLPRADVRQRPAFITVAYGLGLVAQEVWGHARP